MEILSCKALGFAYNGAAQAALENIGFSLEQGDFVLLAGANGCGKSTLLRLLKKEIAPHGKKSGEIRFKSTLLQEISEKESVRSIGYVGRDCMLTSEFVSAQLAFILESLNTAPATIRLKLAEICAEFGLEKLFSKPIDKLSGGERQKVALASVLIAEPELLLLDEPISSLDPVAAGDFLALLQKYCRRRNMTVLIAEHSIEEILPLCSKLLLLQNGKLIFFDEKTALPQSIKEQKKVISSAKAQPASPAVLEIKQLAHKYERQGEYILQNLSLELKKGCCTALIGANGCGKSTLLKLMTGILPPLTGKIKASGKICLLPQNAGDIFTHSSLHEELAAAAPQEEWMPLVQRFRLEEKLESHFLDLSGGELQKAALIRLLLKKPALLMLDEPSSGLDFPAKKELAAILRDLAAEGFAVCFATHDMQLCAEAADEIILLFNKEIACQMPAQEFMAQSSYYRTPDTAASEKIYTLLGS
ncbi:MAG: ABC-F family ATP-binding cassette domain-containing protein [Firmicutes bacterium]|nr:ABC-F family ATP-binding cassette domain-containing protein [Bacillota bacterium]